MADAPAAPVVDPAAAPVAPAAPVASTPDPVLGAGAAAPVAPVTPAAPVVPADYSTVKFADGISADTELVAEYAKALNLDAKAAQGAADVASKVVEHVAEKHMGEITALYTKWADDAKVDPEFGGEKFGENLNVANAVLDKYGTPELKQVLKDTGLGNHPEVIRLFFKVGKLISQDSVAGAIASAASAEKTLAQKMYGGA